MVNLERLESALSSIHRKFVIDEPRGPSTLVAALRNLLPAIDPESWQARLEWGGVYVNGRMKTRDVDLPSPCCIEYFEPKYPFDSRFDFYPCFSADWVLYEDEDLIVSYKPAGLPCLPSREQTHIHLKGYIEKYLRQRVHMPSRLDTATSGMLVMSKSARMNKDLQQAFEFRRMAKYYLMETASAPTWQETLVEAPIGKHEGHPILRAVNFETGKDAKTLFAVTASSSCRGDDGRDHPTAIIRAKPLTGRTHQIRTHAAHTGIPIVGDNFYGGLPAPSLHLMSYQLGFHRPFDRKDFQLILPERFWPEWAVF